MGLPLLFWSCAREIHRLLLINLSKAISQIRKSVKIIQQNINFQERIFYWSSPCHTSWGGMVQVARCVPTGCIAMIIIDGALLCQITPLPNWPIPAFHCGFVFCLFCFVLSCSVSWSKPSSTWWTGSSLPFPSIASFVKLGHSWVPLLNTQDALINSSKGTQFRYWFLELPGSLSVLAAFEAILLNIFSPVRELCPKSWQVPLFKGQIMPSASESNRSLYVSICPLSMCLP